MNLRRAFAPGMHARQITAVARLSGLLFGGLLLPAPSMHAAADTRSPHTHHATLQGEAAQSAGKTPAHLVHDTGARPSRTPEKATSRTSDRAARNKPGTQAAHPRVPAKPRKDALTPKHAKANDDAHAADNHAAHKRHKEPPADDPLPVNRAQGERQPYGAHTQEAARAERRHTGKPLAHEVTAAARPSAPRRTSRSKESDPTEAVQIGTGLTADDFLREARHVPTSTTADSISAVSRTQSTTAPAAFATGVSHPDDDERLPLHSAAALEHRAATSIHNAEASLHHAEASFESAAATVRLAHPAPVPAKTAPALPTMIASATTEAAPAGTEVVEGFGAEVDFHSSVNPAARSAKSAPIVLPHESPAQQERELRAAAEIAAQPMFVPLYARDGKLIVPPPLKGSHDILVHQNQMADDAGLTRIQDDDDLDRLRRAKLLIDFPESASLHMNESLPENRRCARPWTVRFATDIGRAFYSRFGEPLQINSAVRTVAYQLRLQRVNGNAAAIDGEGASPHLTGQALDFGKRGMSVAKIAWMRSYLVPLIDAGKIDVEEEFQQACFHISVYASYAPALRKPRAPAMTTVAQVRSTHGRTAASAAPDADENFR